MMEIGACGKACYICSDKEKGNCDGCEVENERLKEGKCILYECVKEKGVQYCLRCPERPCDWLRGVSMAFCLVSVLRKKS